MKPLLQRNDIFIWIAAATVVLLLLPFMAMQLTAEVNWSGADFILMAGLIFGSASGFVLLARRIPAAKRLWLALAVAVVFLYCWAELAVGIFFNFGS
ncbi:MAG: hypothetical protein KKE30_21565 [Gammaproteobacteria bacterium]|nr:hypothetical protein [Gammaproteobacteria bacterium]MBU1556637.1 hypothetical protein [Gammaproteobacteria bacterium]MBU2069792.1 hypothetical protein [Gammaproteobacteria bacterium]MBU2184657.1 hypothetical protein [Gammaproteobacteria bacterium]MBU2205677.1 hypothetical protein [Gammaproteobacteria bacterium]